MTPAFADRVGKLLLGVAELFEKLPECQGLIERIEIAALDVLDQRDLQGLSIVEFADKRWNLVNSGALGRTPPAFARHNLELAVRARPHDQRLQESLVPDGFCQLIDVRIGEVLAGIVGIGVQQVDWNVPKAADIAWFGRFARIVADQRGKTPSESLSVGLHHGALLPLPREGLTSLRTNMRFACESIMLPSIRVRVE
jgi:hypothetical protein